MGRQKEGYIGGRIGEPLRARLDEIARRFGPADTTMLEDALSALCDYVEANSAYRRPMKIVFDADLEAHISMRAAEGKSVATRLTQKGRETLAAKDAEAASRAGRK